MKCNAQIDSSKENLFVEEFEAIQGIILFKRKSNVKVEILLQSAYDQIMARPFYKTSCFKCTPNFDFMNPYLRCSKDDFKMQDMCI